MLSLIASLIVLLMEKKQDIQTLYSLGLMHKKIKSIFLMIGVFITFLGGVAGALMGLLFCFFQSKFHIIKLNTVGFINAYPIKVNISDIVVILCIVLFLGFCTSYFVSRSNNFYKTQ